MKNVVKQIKKHEKNSNIDQHVMRVAIFEGHKEEKNSRLICKLYHEYFLFPTQISLDPEFSARTMMNLINLHTVRGNLHEKSKILDLETSMSGPHHYFGYLEPIKSYFLKFNDGDYFPTFTEMQTKPSTTKIITKKEIFINCKFGCILQEKDFQWTSHCSPKSENSLFVGPGKMWINQSELRIPTLVDPHLWDLSLFNVQVIDISKDPIQFIQEDIVKYNEAQHRLRLISYYYGSKYYNEYCMIKKESNVGSGNGAFLEKHPFIQFITPLHPSANGFVIVGRYLQDNSLQLITLKIPFGFCLIVNAYAIHGDANLKGLYLMGMTGNHNAMNTADTVFLHSSTGPVFIRSEEEQLITEIDSHKNKDLLITHHQQPYWLLKQKFQSEIETQIYKNVLKKLGVLHYSLWRAKIANPFGYWPKVYNNI